MKYRPPCLAQIPRLARRVARALRASLNAIVLAFLFAGLSCPAADVLTFDPSPTPNVTYRLQWWGTNSSQAQQVSLGTNRMIYLGNGPTNHFTVFAIDTNGVASGPSNELIAIGQPQISSTNPPPLFLRAVKVNGAIAVDVKTNGGSWQTLVIATNGQAPATVALQRAALFRARPTNTPPLPGP